MISASTCARSRPVITANSTSVSNSGGLTGRAQPSASASSVLCRPRPSSSAAGRVVSHGGHRMPGFVSAQQSHCCSFKDVRYGLQVSSGNVSATCRLTVPAYRFRVVRGGPLSVTADAIAAETSRLRPPRAHCWAVARSDCWIRGLSSGRVAGVPEAVARLDTGKPRAQRAHAFEQSRRFLAVVGDLRREVQVSERVAADRDRARAGADRARAAADSDRIAGCRRCARASRRCCRFVGDRDRRGRRPPSGRVRH